MKFFYESFPFLGVDWMGGKTSAELEKARLEQGTLNRMKAPCEQTCHSALRLCPLGAAVWKKSRSNENLPVQGMRFVCGADHLESEHLRPLLQGQCGGSF
jgi:hypothetical protein